MGATKMGPPKRTVVIFGVLLQFLTIGSNARLINLVHVVHEDNPLAKIGIKDAVENFQDSDVAPPHEPLNFREVIIKREEIGKLEQKTLCNRIFEDGFKPTLMIDSLSLRHDDEFEGSLKSLARAKGIPTIATQYGLGGGVPSSGEHGWLKLAPREKEYLVNVYPPGDVIPQAVRDIVIHYNMSTALILYDDSFVMDHKYASLMEGIGNRYSFMKLDTNADQEIMIHDLKKAGEGRFLNYFVLGTPKTINKVLAGIEANSMFGSNYAWYFITKSQGKIKCESCRNAEVFFLKPSKSRTTHYDLANNHSLSRHPALSQDNRLEAFFYRDLAHYALLVVNDLYQKDKWPGHLEYPTCGKPMSSQMKEQRKAIAIASEFAGESFYGLYGRFTFDSVNDLGRIDDQNAEGSNYQEVNMRIMKVNLATDVSKRVGDWEYSAYTEGSGSLMFTAAQSGAGLQQLKIVTIIQAPFVMKDEVNKTRGYYGFCIDLLEEINNALPADKKFSWDISEVQDGSYGVEKKDAKGEWDGMIGALVKKEFDLAVAGLSVTAERGLVVDFTIPYYDLVGITILMKKPEQQSHLFKFLTVLETNVWLCILAAYFFTSFLMYLFDRLSPYSYHNNKEKYKDDDEKREFTLKECLWFCMTSLTPQGGGEAPRNLSGRLVAATWWLFGFIIIASYTANLAAFLTVSRLDSPIESLDDLAKQYKIKYAPMENTASMTYFERMAYIEEKFYEIWKDMSLNDSLSEDERAKLAVWDYPVSDKYTKIWAQIQEAGMPKSFETGLEQVRNSSLTEKEGFALIADATIVQYAAMVHCDTHVVGEEFSRKPLAFAVQKDSPLKDVLNEGIEKLMLERKIETLKERWWRNNPERKQCVDHRKQSDGIGISNIGGVFIVIALGIILATITLIVEYFYFRNKKGSNQVVTIKDYGNVAKNPAAMGAFGGNIGVVRH